MIQKQVLTVNRRTIGINAGFVVLEAIRVPRLILTIIGFFAEKPLVYATLSLGLSVVIFYLSASIIRGYWKNERLLSSQSQFLERNGPVAYFLITETLFGIAPVILLAWMIF